VASIVLAPRRPPVNESLPRGTAREASSRRRGGSPGVDPELREKLAETLREQQVLASVERRAIARLEVDTREKALLVPELEHDVHDLRGLAEVGELVLGGRAAARRGSRAVAS